MIPTLMKNLIFSLLAVCVWSLPGRASILVISDIDDTLKVSKAPDLIAAAEYAPLIDSTFTGMTELLQLLVQKNSAEIVYVSNAPMILMQEIHLEFLNFNQFPDGDVYHRDSIFDPNHKIPTIKEIIRQKRPSQVILIGDNGEQDPVIYQQIQSAFPRIPMRSLIHQVFSVRGLDYRATPLAAGQVPYVTSVDLAGELAGFGFLSESDYQNFVEAVVPRILSEKKGQFYGPLAFPEWKDCRDYLPKLNTRAQGILKKYTKLLQKRCAR